VPPLVDTQVLQAYPTQHSVLPFSSVMTRCMCLHMCAPWCSCKLPWACADARAHTHTRALIYTRTHAYMYHNNGSLIEHAQTNQTNNGESIPCTCLLTRAAPCCSHARIARRLLKAHVSACNTKSSMYAHSMHASFPSQTQEHTGMGLKNMCAVKNP